jgi:hypothetical protein
MTGKICSNCGIEKELHEFHKFTHSKDGRKTICKICISIKNKTKDERVKSNKRNNEWRNKNKEKIKQYKKKDYLKNKDKILLKNKEWRLKNLEKYKEISDSYRDKNRDLLKNKKKEYRDNNREKLLNLTKKWVSENYDRYIKKKKEYNKSEIGLKKKRENYYKNKEKNNHIIAWRTILTNTIKRIGTGKEGKTNEILGYSATQLKEHIEKQFVDGMSWENWGEWHIDHIIPVSMFENTEKISIINSLDNLQPLWASDNLKKSNKLKN